MKLFLSLLATAGVLIGLWLLGNVLLLRAWQKFEETPFTYAVALGDLDGDGDLDAFYGNGKHEGFMANTVLLNAGGSQGGRPGTFIDSGQRLGNGRSNRVALGDLDVDGDLDAVGTGLPLISLFFNDGRGRFTAENRWDEHRGHRAVALGDLDGDGEPDMLAADCCGPDEPVNLVRLNEQDGRLSDVFQNNSLYLPGLGAESVALGDLDGDGDQDAFFGNNFLTGPDMEIIPGQPNTVAWNDGRGKLEESDQRLGAAQTLAVALGDLDGDGDLDAYCANAGPDEVWLNAGGRQGGQQGWFLDSGQRIGKDNARQALLADLDGDGDLDSAVAGESGAFSISLIVEIRWNAGDGNFGSAYRRIRQSRAQAFDAGDLDADGDLDVFIGWYLDQYAIWWNQGDGTFKRG